MPATKTRKATAKSFNGARAVHPQGYRPDLPTRGFTLAELHKTTEEDRAWYAAHPLKLWPRKGDDPFVTPDGSDSQLRYFEFPRKYDAARSSMLRKRAVELNLDLSEIVQ